MFVPDQSLLESFLRGSIVYLSLIVFFRVVLKRQSGSVGLPDVMLVVLVSECVSAALGADARSIPNGLAAVAALLFWNYVLDWLAYRWRWLERRLESAPLPLIEDGQVLKQNMKLERLSDEELLAQLRLNGVDDPGQVKVAFMESEGSISVVPFKEAAGEPLRPDEQSPPDFEKTLANFLEAAAELKKAIAWHEERAADHQKAAKTARDALARHGIRVAKSREPPVKKNQQSSSAEAA